MRRAVCVLMVASLLILEIGSIGSAAVINWGSARTISGDSDVSKTGSLLYAYNIGNSAVQATTVNSVTFAPFVFPDRSALVTSSGTGSVTFTEFGGALWGVAGLGTGSTPYSSLSSSYQALLDFGGGASPYDTITAALGGLTIGQQYQLQWWTSNAGYGPSPAATALSSTQASATNQVTLDANVADSVGGLGQFVIGTFTADGRTQDVSFVGVGGDPLINAFQIRAVPEPSAVPEIEPNSLGSVLALVVGSLGLLERRRLKAA